MIRHPGTWTLVMLLALWEGLVWWADIPEYTLPGPRSIAAVLWSDGLSLLPSWLYTLRITGAALLLAALGGIVVATVFVLFPRLERAFFPVAVVLQVTPIVAIAPLLLIYLPSTTAAVLLCAWIVAFFPVLSNTVQGLRAADPLLQDVFTLAHATRWQRWRWLALPAALPDLMAGLRVSGGLALIGAVTAEMVAGAAGQETGLASRILEASFRTETPKMFAALALLVVTGVGIHAALEALSRKLLGAWHPSYRSRRD
jgi:NitT/TauT family transport system permease protein